MTKTPLLFSPLTTGIAATHFTECGGISGRMVRSERFKYCVYDKGVHRESLYDLETDPGEMRNLARRPEYKVELARHRTLLRQFTAELSDDFGPLVPLE